MEQIKRFWIRIKRSATHLKKSVRPKEPAASAIKTKSARELHPNSKHIRLVFKKKEIKIDKNAVVSGFCYKIFWEKSLDFTTLENKRNLLHHDYQLISVYRNCVL